MPEAKDRRARRPRDALEPRSRDWLQLKWQVMLLAAAPIIAFMAGDLLFGWLSPAGSAPGFPPLELALRRTEAVGRLHMISGFAILAAACLLAMAAFLADGIGVFGPKSRRVLLIACAIGGGVMGWWFLSGHSTFAEPKRHLGPGYVEAAIGRVAILAECDPPRPADIVDARRNIVRIPACPDKQRELLRRFDALIGATRLLLLGALVSLVGGAVSCMALPQKLGRRTSRARIVRFQRQRLRRYLNAVALVLVSSGLAFQALWMRWLTAIYPPKAVPPGLTAQMDAFVIFIGIYYSLIIASYALPVSAALAGAETHSLPGEGEKGLFDRLSFETMNKALAVAAPALAGIIPTAIDLIGGPAN